MNSQNQLYREIQNKKGSTAFRKIKPFQVSKEYNIPLSNQFKEKDDLLFFKYNPLSMKNAGEAIDIEIPLNVNRKMEIEVVDVTDTYNYEIVTDQGHRYRPNKNIKHYRGVVKNNVNSIVALTCFENEIMGIIATEDGNFNIAYDKVTGLHVSYNDRNLKDKYSFLCSTIEDESVMYDAKVLLNPSDDVLLNPSNKTSIRSTTFNIKHVRFYFETEFDIYQARGNSVSSVEAFVTALYNQVATLYRNEGIFTAISEIHVWTREDPYTQMNLQELLTQFQNIRTSINGDIGQLLNFRGLGGMTAGFNALCNVSTRRKLSVSSITQFFSVVPGVTH